jgi:hypothetical protein
MIMNKLLSIFKKCYIIREDDTNLIVYKRKKKIKDIIKINKLTLAVSIEN